jgi:hypothetical protein
MSTLTFLFVLAASAALNLPTLSDATPIPIKFGKIMGKVGKVGGKQALNFGKGSLNGMQGKKGTLV